MKNILVILVIFLTICSGSVYGNNVILDGSSNLNQMAQHKIIGPVVSMKDSDLVILTEREAAMVAYNSYLDNNNVSIPEYKVRVSDVKLDGTVYLVSLKLVSSVDGSFIRNLSQYRVDGKSGEVISSSKVEKSGRSIEDILYKNDPLSQEELAGAVNKIADRGDEVVTLIINDLKENCGDSLNSLATLVRTTKENNPSLTDRLVPVVNSLTQKIFTEVNNESLVINRETIRLLDELRTI